MRRSSIVLAFLLTTIWFVAAQHCALEAAGLAPGCAGAAMSTDDPCARDACGTIEKVQYRPVVSTRKLAAPALHGTFPLLCAALNWLQLKWVPAAPRPAFERPRHWATIWHFVQRAAPPSRAPTPALA